MNLRKTILLGILIAIAIVLSIVESLISLSFFVIPGVKLGLANIVTLLVLYAFGEKEAATVVIIRILLVALISPVSTLISFALSLGGGLAALVVMILLKKMKSISILTVSVFGALAHMIGQISVAIFVLDSPTLIYYLPYMILLSIPTGLITGYVGKRLVPFFKQRVSQYMK